MLGKILNSRYQIIRKLGGGTFGETYLTQDEWLDTDRLCVVKRLKPDVINPVTLRLFEREAQVLTKLGNHDQIPRLLAHFQQDEEFYLVQEFIDGHDLTQEIKPEQLWDEAAVIKLLEEILEVLIFVHQNNVIHRDIKPANMMRRHSDGKIMLIDFGGVKQVKTQPGSTMLTPVVGTRGYMPDEQFKNNAQLCSDIYALGMMAIQALTGLYPYELQRDTKTGQLLWRDQVLLSEGLADVLDQMVQFHFTLRYQSAGEALDAVKNLSLTALYWLKSGDELVVSKDYEQGIAAYDSAIKIRPDYLDAWYNRGIALRKIQRYSEAIASYDQAIKIQPDKPETWYSRGLVLDEMERLEDAIASYDQAIKLRQTYPQAWTSRGIAFNKLAKYNEALASLEKAIQIQPNNPASWKSRSFAFNKLGFYDEALACCDKAVKLQPNYAEAWYERGVTLSNLAKYKDAIASYDQAILLKPDYQLAISNRKLAEKKLRLPFFLRWLGL